MVADEDLKEVLKGLQQIDATLSQIRKEGGPIIQRLACVQIQNVETLKNVVQISENIEKMDEKWQMAAEQWGQCKKKYEDWKNSKPVDVAAEMASKVKTEG